MLAGYQNHYLDKDIDNQFEDQIVRYMPNQQITQYYDQVFNNYYQPFYDLKTQLEFHRKKGN